MGRLQAKVVFLMGAGGVLRTASAALFARDGARIAAVDVVEETVRATVVNAPCPGPIETPHLSQFFPDDESRRIRLARIPMGRLGRPADVAELALYLASDGSSWMTGQTIPPDGEISVNYL